MSLTTLQRCCSEQKKKLNGQPSLTKKERRNNEINLGTHARQHRTTRENPNPPCPQAMAPDVKNVLIANVDQKVTTAVRNIIHKTDWAAASVWHIGSWITSAIIAQDAFAD